MHTTRAHAAMDSSLSLFSSCKSCKFIVPLWSITFSNLPDCTNFVRPLCNGESGRVWMSSAMRSVRMCVTERAPTLTT